MIMTDIKIRFDFSVLFIYFESSSYSFFTKSIWFKSFFKFNQAYMFIYTQSIYLKKSNTSN